MKKIPETIHHIWIQGADLMCTTAKNNLRAIKNLNTGWRHLLWDDPAITSLLQQMELQHFELNGIGQLYRTPPVRTGVHPFAIKSDVARYCILYAHGGCYMDVDVTCVNAIDVILNSIPDAEMERCDAFTSIYPFFMSINVADQFILAKQSSSTLWRVLVSMLERIKCSDDPWRSPTVYECYKNVMAASGSVYAIPESSLSVYHCGVASTCMVPIQSNTVSPRRYVASFMCTNQWTLASVGTLVLFLLVGILVVQLVRRQ